jgi:alkaline phosphatase
MSLKALDLVNKNPRGFFLMIEAGQIDWAGHHNDTGLLLHEMLRANETINSVLRWLGNRDDTLLIITADHETGGFGFSYSGVNIAPAQTLANGIEYKASFNFGNVDILDKLYLQQRSHHELFKSFDALSDNERTPQRLMQLVNENSAFHINQTQAERILLTEDNRFYDASNEQLNLKVAPKMEGNSAFFPYLRSNKENLLAQALANEQQAVWATGTHTSTPVYVFVKGNKKITSGFKKLLHHIDIGRLSIEALK